MQVHGFRADRGLSYGKIERAARYVRAVVAPDVGVVDALPGIELFESLDQHSVTLGRRDIPLGYAVKDLPQGVEAQAQYDPDQNAILVCLSRPTYEALERGYPRGRFTRSKFSLYHEIAHTILHTDTLLRLSAIPHRDAALMRGTKREHPIYMDTEWQAHAFAGAFQAPAAGLLELEKLSGMLTPALVAESFQISLAAAEIRLKVFRDRRAELLF